MTNWPWGTMRQRILFFIAGLIAIAVYVAVYGADSRPHKYLDSQESN
jgi:hypothetical protein